MAEQEPGAGAAQQPQQGQQPQPQVKLLGHFIRDLSFENVSAVEGTNAEGKPEVTVTVNIEGNQAGEGRYVVATKINASAKAGDKTRFLVELDYAGIFSISNAPEDFIHPLVFIECPRLLLPFARRVISDVTRDGGFPPLLIDNVDFASLYRQRLQQMQQGRDAQEGQQPTAPENGNGAAS